MGMLLACALAITTAGNIAASAEPRVLVIRSVEIPELRLEIHAQGIRCDLHEPDPVVTRDELEWEIRRVLEVERGVSLSEVSDFVIVARFEARTQSAAQGSDAFDCCVGGCFDILVSARCFGVCWHPYWRKRYRLTDKGWDGFHNLRADEERAKLVLRVVDARTGATLWKGEAMGTSAHMSGLRDLVDRALYTLLE